MQFFIVQQELRKLTILLFLIVYLFLVFYNGQ